MKLSTKRILLTLATVVGAACTAPPRQAVHRAPATRLDPPPLRAVIFFDKSRSMVSTQTDIPSGTSLTPIYERLKLSGGEIGVGLIGDRSDAPLIRLYVPPPPAAPSFTVPSASNLFARVAVRKYEDSERARFAVALGSRRATNERRIALFAAAIDPLLKRAPDATATDIHSAVARARIFLREPPSFRSPSSIAIFVSDGIDTTHRGEKPQRLPADVLVVNGIGRLGCFAPLHPIRFESLDAAVRYAVTKGDAHVRHE